MSELQNADWREFSSVQFISHQFRLLRTLCGSEREEVPGEGRKLQSEAPRDLYSLLSDYEIKGGEMGERCSVHGGVTNDCEIFRL